MGPKLSDNLFDERSQRKDQWFTYKHIVLIRQNERFTSDNVRMSEPLVLFRLVRFKRSFYI